MSDNLSSVGAAFDARSLEAIKRVAREDPQSGLKAAAKQMEGLFVQMMLKSMRQAMPKGGLFDSQQSEMFTSMLDQQVAQSVASQGKMGFAESMLKSLGGESENVEQARTGAPLLNDLQRQMFARFSDSPLHAFNRAMPDEGAQENSAAERPTGPVRNNASFIAKMSAPAREVAQKSGIPHQLIIAQAALESGWGNREIPTSTGAPSHNLFGIKATPDWKGATTEIMTTEYINGVRTKIKAAFRVYSSYSEGLSDYTALLMRNPRYEKVLQSTSAEMGAQALQAGGYATDPQYANKLISIINNVRNELNRTAKSYSSDLYSLF